MPVGKPIRYPLPIRNLRPHHRLLHRLHHISDQIRPILHATRQPHQIIEHARRLALLARDPRMRHGPRDFAQTLNPTERLREGENLRRLAEALGRFLAATQPERQHPAAQPVAVLLQRDFAVFVGGETRVVDGEDVRGGLQGLGDEEAVLGRFAGTEVQGFDAAVGEPAVEGGGDGADRVLEEGEAGVEVGGVEGGDTHEDVGVPVDVFGDAVDDDVGAVLEWVLDVGGEEGVVDDDHDAAAVRDVGYGSYIYQGEGRVGGRLDPDQLSLWFDLLLDVELDGGGEGNPHTVRRCHFREVSVRAAIYI